VLFKQLIQPIYKQNIPKHLLVIPDGYLGYLPFSILLTETVALEQAMNDTDIRRTYRKLPYMGLACEMGYAYSMRTLLNKKKGKYGGTNLLAFAPTYEGVLKLSSNQAQVQSLSKFMESTVLLGQKATKEAFVVEASKHNILHLAMHGQPNADAPMASRLLFSQAKNAANDQEGNLYAYEIFGLNLSADLAVLSACETGAGALSKGEGVQSLARAFRFAGCKSVVYSLWQADGAAANRLISTFYQQLTEGERKTAALQKAQSIYLDKVEPTWVHPYYWSTFVISGEQNPINVTTSRPYIWAAISVLIVGLIFFLKKRKKS
jgi:CHAT domain-containing protein